MFLPRQFSSNKLLTFPHADKIFWMFFFLSKGEEEKTQQYKFRTVVIYFFLFFQKEKNREKSTHTARCTMYGCVREWI